MWFDYNIYFLYSAPIFEELHYPFPHKFPPPFLMNLVICILYNTKIPPKLDFLGGLGMEKLCNEMQKNKSSNLFVRVFIVFYKYFFILSA